MKEKRVSSTVVIAIVIVIAAVVAGGYFLLKGEGGRLGEIPIYEGASKVGAGVFSPGVSVPEEVELRTYECPDDKWTVIDWYENQMAQRGWIRWGSKGHNEWLAYYFIRGDYATIIDTRPYSEGRTVLYQYTGESDAVQTVFQSLFPQGLFVSLNIEGSEIGKTAFTVRYREGIDNVPDAFEANTLVNLDVLINNESVVALGATLKLNGETTFSGDFAPGDVLEISNLPAFEFNDIITVTYRPTPQILIEGLARSF